VYAIPIGIFGMGVVHREIERGEGKLPSIENTGSRFLGVVHFLNDLSRDFLGRIAVVSRESIEHFFVPNPVLQHLRRRFDKIAGNMRAAEASVLRTGGYFMEAMTEFVKQHFNVGMRHE